MIGLYRITPSKLFCDNLALIGPLQEKAGEISESDVRYYRHGIRGTARDGRVLGVNQSGRKLDEEEPLAVAEKAGLTGEKR